MRSIRFEGQLEPLAQTLTEQFGVQIVCQGDNAWTQAACAEPHLVRQRRRTGRVLTRA